MGRALGLADATRLEVLRHVKVQMSALAHAGGALALDEAIELQRIALFHGLDEERRLAIIRRYARC